MSDWSGKAIVFGYGSIGKSGATRSIPQFSPALAKLLTRPRPTLVQDGVDRVRVSGARGRPATDQYKVSATYQDGYRAVATVSIVGPCRAACKKDPLSGVIGA